jgi:valyl-tRNA synthetase
VSKSLEDYRFMEAGDTLYHFTWHRLADEYIEHVKSREDKEIALGVLRYSYIQCLKMLHPFMPFVTEKIWQNLPEAPAEPLIISDWPQS